MANIKNIPSFFRLAKNAAELSEHPKHKMGAVIIKGSRVIAFGNNKNRSHPQAWHNGLHCEMEAIRQCPHDVKQDLRNATIYVYRITRQGKIGMSKPCELCMNELKKLGFKEVYYSTNEFPFWNYEKI